MDSDFFLIIYSSMLLKNYRLVKIILKKPVNFVKIFRNIALEKKLIPKYLDHLLDVHWRRIISLKTNMDIGMLN